MKVIPIKGTIISNNSKWIYELFEREATAPKDIVLPETGEDVEIHINSGGGDVYAGSEIYTALRAYSGRVTVKIVGIAASAASVIAMAGDSVEISPTAQIMIHNVSSGVYGDHNALEHEATVLKGFNKSIASAYVHKTGKALPDLLELMNQTTWFDAEAAVENGFADKVMFAQEVAPLLVASETPMIPQDFIERMQATMTPDVDKIAELVAQKLAEHEPEKTNTENKKATGPSGFGRFAF